MAIFYLGSHEPHWLTRLDLPLCISARRLRRLNKLPKARHGWVLDSGGFSELSLYGEWKTPAMQYSTEVRKWAKEIGKMRWAAIQDWMCEPFMLEKTGFSLAFHQWSTVRSYLLLRQLAPDLPWLPVLQGWEKKDYLSHVAQYKAEGIDLRDLPSVGLGSICRRQATAEAEEIVKELSCYGIKLHGFGFKIEGLRNVSQFLESSDSMAWSRGARYEEPLPGCTHKTCSNCIRYAQHWYNKVLEANKDVIFGCEIIDKQLLR